MPLFVDPFGKDNPGYAIPIKFENEMSPRESHPCPPLNPWQWLKPNFESPAYFFEDTGAAEGQYKQIGMNSKKSFAAFLDRLRGPYYVRTDGNDQQTVTVVILHALDREDFAEKYSAWRKLTSYNAEGSNALRLVQLILKGFEGETPGMKTVLHAVASRFASTKDKTALLVATNAIGIESQNPTIATQHENAALAFVNAALESHLPVDLKPLPPKKRRPDPDFDDYGLD